MPKNNLDYENFVARMGSFDDNFDDLFPDELTHMANKSITIKEATDKELDDLLVQLQKENDSLYHFGILGMKWGRRRGRRNSSKIAEKNRKADMKWAKRSQRTYFEIYNHAVNNHNPKVKAFNEKFTSQEKNKGLNLHKSIHGPVEKRYLKEYSKMFEDELNTSAKIYGISPSGQKQMVFKYDAATDSLPRFEIVDRKIEHSMGNSVDDVLQHFGVLGMRWGRRRGKIGSLKKIVSDRITEYNDHRNNSSDDYKKNVDLKKKRINELSNAELKSLNERLQLERNYKDLSAKDVSKGRKFAQEILREVAKEIIKENVKDAMKTGIKRAF